MSRGRWNNTVLWLGLFFVVGLYLHFKGDLSELQTFVGNVSEGRPHVTSTNPYKAPEPDNEASDTKVITAPVEVVEESEASDSPKEATQTSTKTTATGGVSLERALAQRDFALPAIKKTDQIVRRVGYVLSYNEAHEQANWVAYPLTAEMVAGNQKRENVFMPDPVVSTGSAVTSDYTNSGYDRGHLAPAADFRANFQLMKETFYMSNISPQNRQFNGGKWSELEQLVRAWATRYKQIYVVTGPVLEPGLPKIGRVNKVSVPKQFYKIVLYAEPPHVKGIAFLMPNEPIKNELSHYVVPIDQVEKLTGIDFYPALPDDIEKKVEAKSNPKEWPRLK